MGGQLWTQVLAVAVTIAWCGIGSAILYRIVDAAVGLRTTPEAELQGLDLASHGEMAYHS
jgi:Amt family ammonium transporter